eukprot:scaffold291406_cov19-Tisochrysis_lutea.AAC.1
MEEQHAGCDAYKVNVQDDYCALQYHQINLYQELAQSVQASWLTAGKIRILKFTHSLPSSGPTTISRATDPIIGVSKVRGLPIWFLTAVH